MNDDLSRLLDGELPAVEAEVLRARIAADPALAERWARMQGLAARMRALAPEISVPAGVALPVGVTGPVLGAALVGVAPRRADPTTRVSAAPPLPSPLACRSPYAWRVAVVGWAAAAGLALFAGRPAPERVLVQGTEWVSGRADVLAGDIHVRVDGKVKFHVEPPRGAQREIDAEANMNSSHLLAALVGSVVTITVLEGSAWYYGENEPRTEVVAGETKTFPVTAPGVTTKKSAAGSGSSAGLAAPGVAGLEGQVARLEREKLALSAKLRRYEGEAQPRPANTPAAFQPDSFARFVAARVALVPDAELVSLDCEEFPCVAVVECHSTSADWDESAASLHDDLDGQGFGEQPRVLAIATESSSPDGDLHLYGFSIGPEDMSETASARVRYRADGVMKDITGEGE